MADKGFKRYLNLSRNIANPLEYIINRSKRHKHPLSFTTKPNRINFVIPDSLYQVFKEIFMEDVYEINHLVAKLPQHPIVVDIGANAGFFGVILLSKIKSATIYAYEPIPSNVHFIENMMQQNPALRKSIYLEESAVTGKEVGFVDLYFDEQADCQVVASVFDNFNKNNTSSTKVKAISLTNIISDNNLSQIDLLKIDCEGSEYEIIYNTTADVLRIAKQIAIEVHDIDKEKNNFSYMKSYLEEVGYTVEAVAINDFCHAVNAVLV